MRFYHDSVNHAYLNIPLYDKEYYKRQKPIQLLGPKTFHFSPLFVSLPQITSLFVPPRASHSSTPRPARKSLDSPTTDWLNKDKMEPSLQ